MDCVVNGGNVKGSKTYPPFTCPEKEQQLKTSVLCVYRSVLAKAIYSLSRIGDDLYVEPQDDGVSSSDAAISVHGHTLPPWMHIVAVFPVWLHTLRQSSILLISLSLSLYLSHSSRCGLSTPPARHMPASCLHHFSSAGADCFCIQVAVKCAFEDTTVFFVKPRNV